MRICKAFIKGRWPSPSVYHGKIFDAFILSSSIEQFPSISLKATKESGREEVFQGDAKEKRISKHIIIQTDSAFDVSDGGRLIFDRDRMLVIKYESFEDRHSPC